jgi:hypothetical protein
MVALRWVGPLHHGLNYDAARFSTAAHLVRVTASYRND